jgi:hypothetical protein
MIRACLVWRAQPIGPWEDLLFPESLLALVALRFGFDEMIQLLPQSLREILGDIIFHCAALFCVHLIKRMGMFEDL